MKRNIKQLITLGLIGTTLLAGCATANTQTSTDEPALTIGVSQFAEHPALDQVREGFIETLTEANINFEIDYQNAQGDIAMTSTIASKFVSDKVNLMLTIGTASTQGAKQATSDIPILFSAVTDPVQSGIVENRNAPEQNITGTTDQTPIKKQLELFRQIDPSIQTIGIMFNTSEANSLSQIEEAEQIAKELDLNIVTLGINNVNDVVQAADALLAKVDAIYTITDNTVASSIGIISQKAIEQNKIVIGAEESHVTGGALITDGISYKELGKQTGQMAIDILVNNKDIKDIPVQILENTTKTVNQRTLDKLNLDSKLEVFQDALIVE